AGAAGLAGAGHGSDPARLVDDAQRVPRPLGDVEVAGRVEPDRARVHERFGERVAAVLRHSRGTAAGDGPDQPGLQVDGAHPAVAEVADVERVAVKGDVEDAVE